VTLAGHQHAAEFPDDLRRISAQIRDTRTGCAPGTTAPDQAPARRPGRNSWRFPAGKVRQGTRAEPGGGHAAKLEKLVIGRGMLYARKLPKC
jgi:hypothetical protein